MKGEKQYKLLDIVQAGQGLIACVEEWLETGQPPEDREAVEFLLRDAKEVFTELDKLVGGKPCIGKRNLG